MASNEMNSSGNAATALGVLIGVIAGVAAGMLMAPKSGAETRQQLRDKAIRVKAKVGTTAHDTGEGTRRQVGRIVEKTKAAVAAGSEAARNT